MDPKKRNQGCAFLMALALVMICMVLVAPAVMAEFKASGVEKPIQVETDDKVLVVPAGHSYVGAFEGPVDFPPKKYYCINNQTDRLYICYDGYGVGEEVKIPDGYRLVGTYQTGQLGSYTNLLCQKMETNEIYKCSN